MAPEVATDSQRRRFRTTHSAAPCHNVNPVHPTKGPNPPSRLYGTEIVPNYRRIWVFVAHIHRPDSGACANVKNADCSVLWKLGKVQLVVQKQQAHMMAHVQSILLFLFSQDQFRTTHPLQKTFLPSFGKLYAVAVSQELNVGGARAGNLLHDSCDNAAHSPTCTSRHWMTMMSHSSVYAILSNQRHVIWTCKWHVRIRFVISGVYVLLRKFSTLNCRIEGQCSLRRQRR